MAEQGYKSISRGQLFAFVFVPVDVQGITHEIAGEIIDEVRRSNSKLARILSSKQKLDWKVYRVPTAPESSHKRAMGMEVLAWSAAQQNPNNLWFEQSVIEMRVDASGTIQPRSSSVTRITEITLMVAMLKND